MNQLDLEKRIEELEQRQEAIINNQLIIKNTLNKEVNHNFQVIKKQYRTTSRIAFIYIVVNITIYFFQWVNSL